MLKIQYKISDVYRLEGETYSINACFDNILRILDLMVDPTIPEFMRYDIALEMLLGDDLPEYDAESKQEILKDVLSNYVKAEKEVIRDIAGNVIDLPGKESEPVFDYYEDSELIYAAFMQVYGIDLIEEQGKLHWSKFKALLEGLPSGTRLTEIISIRSWNEFDEKKSYKQHMREMKQKHRLKGGQHG